jgi:hypothetical protein
MVHAKVAAVSARFTDKMLYIALNDGLEIGLLLTLPWLSWLAQATPEQRARWSLEPRGFAVYWEDLDNGIEVAYLLSPQPV